jgi:hypothetical protein
LEAAVPTVESLTADTLFAVLHGIGAHKNLGQVVKLRAAEERNRRGFTVKQLEAPVIEGDFTRVPPAGRSSTDAPAEVLVPKGRESPSPSQAEFETQVPTEELSAQRQVLRYPKLETRTTRNRIELRKNRLNCAL